MEIKEGVEMYNNTVWFCVVIFRVRIVDEPILLRWIYDQIQIITDIQGTSNYFGDYSNKNEHNIYAYRKIKKRAKIRILN